MHYYQASVMETFDELRSSPSGLSAEEARVRLDRYGPNELIEKKKKSALAMFLGQFAEFMIIVLLAAAAVSGIIGEAADAVAIIVIVLLNAVLGFSQEYRAEKAMAALKRMAAGNAVALRDGSGVTVAASELVPGDVVLLEAGKIVPADMRVIEAALLKVEEAALTGESAAVEKQGDSIRGDHLPLGDRKNMLYKGTVVVSGRAVAVVTATGMHTELGRIAAMLQGAEDVKTPLQKRLAVFGRHLAFAVLAICAVIFTAGLMRGEGVVDMFLLAVSLAVAAIPEALPAVVTITLAFGARKMVKNNALVRKLPAVETLGSVTYICTDKTGTLTENRMTVEEVWVDGESFRSSDSGVHGDPSLLRTPNAPLRTFYTALAVSNDAHSDASGALIGDPTETALVSAAREQGFMKRDLETALPRIAELPFDSERKLMTTVHEGSGGRGPGAGENVKFISFTKGAPDALLDRADSMLTASGPQPVDRERMLAVHDEMAARGLRVIGIAMRAWNEVPDQQSPALEQGLTFLGLAGMMDPPRAAARESVALCKTAGITPVMITGDHPLTARVIARRVGILETDAPGSVITGSELASLPIGEFEKRVESIRVYARVAPEQKLKIVKALRDRGHFVAMTGDGVNDAPALKTADIGVAMGITGTDVAKEASSLILLDDDFSTIVKAVKEGRRIFDNIRKFIKYTMTSNSGEIWTIGLAPFLGLPIPLFPIHILWINLVTDGLPGLALAAEPSEKGLMERPPRQPTESIFSHGLGGHIVWVGLLMGAVSLGTQAWAIEDHVRWRTMVFTVLCLLQLGHVLAIRSEKESFFTQGLMSNKPLLAAVVLSVALQLATVYVPALNPIFKTKPLGLAELAAVIVLSSVVFFAVELEKLIKRRRKTP